MKLLLRNGLLAMAACLAAATAAQATEHTKYDVINVSPPGVQSAEGVGVQNTVVGFANYSSPQTRGFYHYDGTTTTIGTLGGSSSKILDIGNGDMVGVSQNVTGANRAFHLYTGDNVLTELLLLPGYTESRANGVQFIGHSVAGSMTSPSLGTHAAWWRDDNSAPIDLGADAEALSISRAGYIVGHMGGQATMWDSFINGNGMPTFLGTLGGSTSVATAMPTFGPYPIVGYSKLSGDLVTHAFLWDGAASMVDLGTLPGMTDSFAYGVSDYNYPLQVVGESSANGVSRAFLWEDGIMYDLNSLIPATSGWELLTARGTDGYTITGTGMYQGKRQAFLLKPPGPPVTTAVVNGSKGCNSTYITPVTVTLTATASQNVGVLEIRYSINNAPYVVVPGDSAVINLDSEGSFAIKYYAVDNGGLTGSVWPLNLNIDWTAPTTGVTISAGTLGNNGWFVSDVTMLMSYTTDPDGARPTRYYSIDGGAYASLVGPINSFVVSGSGSHYIDHYAVDAACNTEPVKRFAPVPVDMIAPVVTVGTSPSTLRSSSTSNLVNVTITGTATDVTSGVDTVSVSVADEYGVYNYSGLTIGSVIQVDTFKPKTDKNGRIYTITALATDKAGNQATATYLLTIR